MDRCSPTTASPWRLTPLLAVLLLLISPATAAAEVDALFDLSTPPPNPLFDLGAEHPETEEGDLPWNANIHATTFAIHGVHRSGLGHILDGQHDYFVALPAVRDDFECLDGRMMCKDKSEGTITCRVIEIRPHGKEGPVLEATVEDIGPWNISDPYWIETARPIAESGRDLRGRKTNKAGIDMSPALRKALGLPRSAKVDWRFKTDDEGNIVTVTRTEGFRA